MARSNGKRRLFVRVTVAVVAAVGALTALAFASGRVEYVVTHGVSMNPLYYQGDAVMVMAADHYKVGDIVAYRDSVNDLTVLHRIIGGDPAGWTIKGDNNQSVDAERPPSTAIIGRAVLHVPKLGLAIESPFGRVGLTGLMALVAFGIASVSRPSKLGQPTVDPKQHKSRRTKSPKQPRPQRRDRPKPVRQQRQIDPPRRRLRARALQWLLVAVDALLVVALVAAFAFAVKPGPPIPGVSLRGSLRYTAEVPLSETYPTGHVDTGDPVFARLVNTVALAFELDTDTPADHLTGVVQLDLVLANSSGWHTRINLAEPKPTAAGTTTLTGSLDLAHLNELVAKVAEATGLNAGGAELTVIASGSTSVAGGPATDFSMPYQFSLNGLALTSKGQAPVADAATDTPATAAKAADTPGSALMATQPLTEPQPTSTGRITAAMRMKIVLALILAVATTFIAWPSKPDTDEDESASGGAVLEHGHACACATAAMTSVLTAALTAAVTAAVTATPTTEPTSQRTPGVWSAPRTPRVSTLPPMAMFGLHPAPRPPSIARPIRAKQST